MILNIQSAEDDATVIRKNNVTILKGSWKRKHLHKKKIRTIQDKKDKNVEPRVDQKEEKEIKILSQKEKKPVKKNLNPINVVSQLWSHGSNTAFSGATTLDLKPSVNPLMENSIFNDLGIEECISKHLVAKLGISQPTPIQSKVIPQFLNSQKDILIQAQTGSGKSLAFLLPVMNQLIKRKELGRDAGTLGLILAPTRELASQLYGVLGSLVRLSAPGKHWIVPGLLIGGEKKKSVRVLLP